VTEVLDSWLAPEHRYFKIRGEDDGTYILRHDVPAGTWTLTMFESEALESAGAVADPGTPATRYLSEHGVTFAVHLYDYEERGGAPHAAASLRLPEHEVIKTLVMHTETGRQLLVLMHGDQRVSSKRLARALGARRIRASSPEAALEATGYVVGGISPFGTRTRLPIYAETSIFDLPRIFINGGRRGMLLEIAPQALRQTLELHAVSVAS
jgi:Cys-tRNA(Pro) deacylase